MAKQSAQGAKVPYPALKPRDMSDSAWTALIEAWENGLSDREAAFRISKSTNARTRESDIRELKHKRAEIAELCDYLHSSLLAQAKLNVREKIMQGDIATSKWYLERKAADEFSTKAAVAFDGAAVELSIADKERATRDFMKKFGDGTEPNEHGEQSEQSEQSEQGEQING